MQKRIYADYAELTRQKKHIETKLEELKPLILADLAKEGVEKFQHESGTFTRWESVSYEYGDEIAGLADMLKQRKEIAVDNGEAVKKVTETIRFQPSKEASV